MKQLILFALILGVSISCKKASQDAVPSDPLYRKWQLVEIQNRTGAWEPVPDELLLELRSDGSIRYPNSEPACCSPIRFERRGEALRITDIHNGEDCIYVDCAAPSAYNLVSLTATELILKPVYPGLSPVSSNNLKYKLVP